MAAALQAYLARCGVASSSLKRYPSYSQPQLVANQVGRAGAVGCGKRDFRYGEHFDSGCYAAAAAAATAWL